MPAADDEPAMQSAHVPARVDAWLWFAVLAQGLVMAALSISTIAGLKPQLESALNIQEQRVVLSYDSIRMVSPSQIDLSSSLYALSFVFIMPIWIWLARRIGYRATCFAALLLFSTGSLGIALSGSQVFRLTLDINWLLAWRIVQGLGGGAFLPLTAAQTWHIYAGSDIEPYSAAFYTARSRARATEIAVYIALAIALVLGWFYSAYVMRALGDWFWIPLLNVLFSLSAIVLLSTVPTEVEADDIRIDWLIWILLVFIILVFAFSLTVHPPILLTRDMPTDGCIDLCSYVIRHLL